MPHVADDEPPARLIDLTPVNFVGDLLTCHPRSYLGPREMAKLIFLCERRHGDQGSEHRRTNMAKRDGQESAVTVRASKCVTLSAFVQRPTLPGNAKVWSFVLNKARPLNEMMNVSPTAFKPRTCHVSDGTGAETPWIPRRDPLTTR